MVRGSYRQLSCTGVIIYNKTRQLRFFVYVERKTCLDFKRQMRVILPFNLRAVPRLINLWLSFLNNQWKTLFRATNGHVLFITLSVMSKELRKISIYLLIPFQLCICSYHHPKLIAIIKRPID